MAEPFVGRVPELALIAELCRRARGSARPTGAPAFGRPGSGKSRLLAEVHASLADCTHLRMVGYEPERGVPLAAASDLLRALASSEAGDGLLRRLLAGELPSGGPLDTVRVLEAAHRARSALGPTLVTVDDVQWVDSLSIALAHYLVRAAAGSGGEIVLLAAGRATAEVGAFDGSLSGLLGTEDFLRLDLGPLDHGDSLRLVGALAPGLAPARAEEIVAAAGGSPFWIRSLAGAGTGAADAGEVVDARMWGASLDASAAAGALAVAARPIAVPDLARLLEIPPERAEAAVAELAARGLAVERGGAARLAHDLIRDAADRALDDAERVRLHRGLAQLLEAEGEDDVR